MSPSNLHTFGFEGPTSNKSAKKSRVSQRGLNANARPPAHVCPSVLPRFLPRARDHVAYLFSVFLFLSILFLPFLIRGKRTAKAEGSRGGEGLFLISLDRFLLFRTDWITKRTVKRGKRDKITTNWLNLKSSPIRSCHASKMKMSSRSRSDFGSRGNGR